jgi:hypothetical protein|tara:strand:- start:449 stop:1231 length:783 start_codon:yes stop_codon:yes gene_type:complete
MAISRAQIPEQIDVFEEGGGATLDPQTIIDLYGALESPPITATDIQTEAEQLSSLFPQPRKQNIFDLASSVGAGLVGAAADPRGLGAGLTAGFQAFNERANKIKAERDAIKQQAAMLAYQQVQDKRNQQLETSKEILEMQFEQALESGGGMFEGTSVEAAALNYILRAEANPALKNTPEYKIAVAVASKPRTSLQQTETGTIQVEIPGLDIEEILGEKAITPPSEIEIGGTKWEFTGRRDANGDPIYSDGKQDKVIKPGT